MQEGSFIPRSLRLDTEGLVSRINDLSTRFRENGNTVIFIQHDGTSLNEFIPGTFEWEILPELNRESSDIFITKTTNDCFYNSALAERLKELNISELLITGCATDFCVDSTVKSAITKGYDVTIVADGHTTADRPTLKAGQVIAHYNWVWANMVPVNGDIKVVNTNMLFL